MKEGVYSVQVSSLEIRKEPKIASKLTLKRGTIVKVVGDQKQYKREYWIYVQVLDNPIIAGYVQFKYLSKI